MKKILLLLLATALSLSCVLPVLAEDGNVSYDDKAKTIIFSPGSEFSPTDLFPNFKDVVPGDTLTQKITVRNKASDKVKVKIYLRSLGAHPASVEFLSQLRLRVQKSEENEMPYMFDAAADATAQLTDWVCLGTLYSGGVVNLDVILEVPVELDNAYQDQIGYLDWEFRIEEYPIEDTDPSTPPTGDQAPVGLWIALMLLAAAGILILLTKKKKTADQ